MTPKINVNLGSFRRLPGITHDFRRPFLKISAASLAVLWTNWAQAPGLTQRQASNPTRADVRGRAGGPEPPPSLLPNRPLGQYAQVYELAKKLAQNKTMRMCPFDFFVLKKIFIRLFYFLLTIWMKSAFVKEFWSPYT